MTKGPFSTEALNRLVEQSMSGQPEVEDNAAAGETAITIDMVVRFHDEYSTTMSKNDLTLDDAEDVIAELRGDDQQGQEEADESPEEYSSEDQPDGFSGFNDEQE